MESDAAKAYAAFEERVKRTVYLDNLSPQVTTAVITSALNQYADVTKVDFIPNYTEPNRASCCALAEVKDARQAANVVEELNAFPFMMSGMPRPVRAQFAKVEMFDDRPAKPGRKIQLRWLDPSDPDFETAQKLKELVKKHEVERSYMLKRQLEQEESLSKAQAETLKGAYEKHEKIESELGEKTCGRLAKYYGMKSNDGRSY